MFQSLGHDTCVPKENTKPLLTCYFIVCVFSAIGLYLCGGIGITAGAHRLWAHRTYKAKLPLRILLGMFNCVALQVNRHPKSHPQCFFFCITETTNSGPVESQCITQQNNTNRRHHLIAPCTQQSQHFVF